MPWKYFAELGKNLTKLCKKIEHYEKNNCESRKEDIVIVLNDYNFPNQ